MSALKGTSSAGYRVDPGKAAESWVDHEADGPGNPGAGRRRPAAARLPAGRWKRGEGVGLGASMPGR